MRISAITKWNIVPQTHTFRGKTWYNMKTLCTAERIYSVWCLSLTETDHKTRLTCKVIWCRYLSQPTDHINSHQPREFNLGGSNASYATASYLPEFMGKLMFSEWSNVQLVNAKTHWSEPTKCEKQVFHQTFGHN